MVDKVLVIEDGKLVRKPASDIDVSVLTEYEFFTDDATEATTSNDFIVKSNYPYTSAVKSAGKYIVDFSAEIGQTNANKKVGYRIEYRLGTTGAWIILGDFEIVNPQSNGWRLVTGFREIELLSSSEIQIQVLWGDTDSGGTGFIRFAGIKLGKVAD